MKGPLEVNLTRTAPPRRPWCSSGDDDFVYDGDVGVVRIGRTLADVDTAFSESDDVTKRWLTEVTADARGRRLRAPHVVGLVALRGHDPADSDGYWWSNTGFRPHNLNNPIRCVALCLGGSRVLVYRPDAHGYRVRRPDGSVGARLKFYGNNMTQLREFLDDKRFTVACFGAREVTKKLAKEWGLHVAWPAEVTDLFVRAYGKVAGVEVPKANLKKPAKYWMGKAALARARAEADQNDYDTDTDEEEDLTYPGTKRAPKVVRGLNLERMARVALGPEVRLARWPGKVVDADWGSHRDLREEEWAYATRDAYLCCEIAARCLQKLGAPIGA